MTRLDGGCVVVTGGASGIGEATVRAVVAGGGSAVIADLQSIGQFRQVIAPPTRSAAPNALPVGALALPSRKACSMLDVGKHISPRTLYSTRTDGPSLGHKEHVSRHVFLDCISMFVANKCSWGQVGLHPIGDALRRSGNCAHA